MSDVSQILNRVQTQSPSSMPKAFSGRDRPKIEWSIVQVFEKDGIAVQVTSSGGNRPRFSLSVGRYAASHTAEAPARFTGHIGIFTEGQGTLSLRAPLFAVIGNLVAQAESWILAQAQTYEDEFLEQRTQKESRQANFGKPQARHTGKTERKRAKQKGRV